MKDNYKNKIEKVGIHYRLWRSMVRPTILKNKGNKCSTCGSTKFLDIHHLSYEEQTYDNLIILCRKCHRDETFKNNKRIPTKYLDAKEVRTM